MCFTLRDYCCDISQAQNGLHTIPPAVWCALLLLTADKLSNTRLACSLSTAILGLALSLWCFSFFLTLSRYVNQRETPGRQPADHSLSTSEKHFWNCKYAMLFVLVDCLRRQSERVAFIPVYLAFCSFAVTK